MTFSVLNNSSYHFHINGRFFLGNILPKYIISLSQENIIPQNSIHFFKMPINAWNDWLYFILPSALIRNYNTAYILSLSYSCFFQSSAFFFRFCEKSPIGAVHGVLNIFRTPWCCLKRGAIPQLLLALDNLCRRGEDDDGSADDHWLFPFCIIIDDQQTSKSFYRTHKNQDTVHAWCPHPSYICLQWTTVNNSVCTQHRPYMMVCGRSSCSRMVFHTLSHT